MKKILLNIAACSLFLMACKKDDAAPQEEWYLSKFTSVEAGDTDTTTTSLKYSDASVLTELKESGVDGNAAYSLISQPVLEGGKLVKIMASDLNSTTPVIKNSFVYTGNAVTRINEYGFNALQEWVIAEYYEITYNAQQKIDKMVRKSTSNTDYATVYKLTWDGENVKSMTAFNVFGMDTSQANTENNTYDNKPSFTRALFKDNYLWLSSPSSFELLSANNLVKQDLIFGGETYYRFTYEFKFNERNQLAEQKMKTEQLLDGTAESTSITTFTYTKK